MFNEKKLLRPYSTSSQSPLDTKGYFSDEADMLDISNLRPLEWFKNLRAINMSNNKTYTWKESVLGLINGGYTYPDNVVSFGVIYSNKTFNFVEDIESDGNSTTLATEVFLSNNFAPHPNSSTVLSGDDVDTSIRKLVRRFSFLTPVIDKGNLTVIVENTGYRINGTIVLTKEEEGQSDIPIFTGSTTNGTIVFNDLDVGKYNVTFNNPEYDVLESSSISDNNTSDNTIFENNAFNADIGPVDSIITFQLQAGVIIPIVNSFLINEGDESTSNPNLRLELDITGAVTEISITKTINSADNFIPYNGSPVAYFYDYISSITANLFIKVRNPNGVSEQYTDSIDLINGIVRSDSATTYNNLRTALEDISAEYPNGLTQNVEVSAISEVLNTITGDWIAELFNFNRGGLFFLKINGNNLLTLDCDTVGGLRLDFSDNIIIQKINFVNVGSLQNHSVPEQMCAIFSNGCNNIVIDQSSIDGRYLDDLTITGRYGIVIKDSDNFTISRSTIKYFKATAIDVADTGSFFFLKSTISDCTSATGIVSQPSLLNLSNVDFLKIEDSTIDSYGMDTGVSGINVTRTYINRSTLKNSRGEILSFQNTKPSLILSIKNCLIHDNLLNPVYSWTKQQIEVNFVQKLEMVNNTIEMRPIRTADFYPKVVRALSGIGHCIFYNNIVDFNMATMVNNSAQSAILHTKTIEVLEWDYNLYRDNINEDGGLINIILMITESTSNVYLPSNGRGFDTLEKMALVGADTNSRVIEVSEPLLTSESYTDIVPQLLSDTPSLASVAPLYDINKFTKNIIANIGCQYLSGEVGINVTEIEYFGTTLTDGTNFEEVDISHILYSGSKFVVEVDSYNDEAVYLWRFSTPGNTDIVKIGNGVLVSLFSELDQEGLYVSDKNYSLTIEKI